MQKWHKILVRGNPDRLTLLPTKDGCINTHFMFESLPKNTREEETTKWIRFKNHGKKINIWIQMLSELVRTTFFVGGRSYRLNPEKVSSESRSLDEGKTLGINNFQVLVGRLSIYLLSEKLKKILFCRDAFIPLLSFFIICSKMSFNQSMGLLTVLIANILFFSIRIYCKFFDDVRKLIMNTMYNSNLLALDSVHVGNISGLTNMMEGLRRNIPQNQQI